MTKADFLRSLRTRQEVSFGESALEAPTDIVCKSLVESLETTLHDEEMVRFGAETSYFGPDWTGQLTWLLVLSRHLLVLTASVDKDPETQRASSFTIRQTTYPLSRVTCGTIDLDYKGRVQLQLSEARLLLKVDEQEIQVSGEQITPKGLGQFLRAVVVGQSDQGPRAAE